MTTTARWTVVCDAAAATSCAAPISGVTRAEAEGHATSNGWRVLDPWNAVCPNCLAERDG